MPRGVYPRKPKPLADRFWAKVQRGADDDCWLWTGYRCKARGGYGYFYASKGEALSAHRLAYKLAVGPIPDGLHLDHLCRNPPCVNPRHLEPATPLVNAMRSTGAAPRNAAKTHCPKGHPYAGDNLKVWTSPRTGRPARMCRTCAAENRRRRQARQVVTGLDPADRRHGTTTGYSYGCRCEACRTAKAAAHQRAKHKESKG